MQLWESSHPCWGGNLEMGRPLGSHTHSCKWPLIDALWETPINESVCQLGHWWNQIAVCRWHPIRAEQTFVYAYLGKVHTWVKKELMNYRWLWRLFQAHAKAPSPWRSPASASARTAPFSLVTNEMASAVRESLLGKRFTLFLKMCLEKNHRNRRWIVKCLGTRRGIKILQNKANTNPR